MDSKTLYDAKNYWNDIKLFIIPNIRKDVTDERIEHLINQIEISLETNDISVFYFDVDEEINRIDRRYGIYIVETNKSCLLLSYIILIYDFIKYLTSPAKYNELIITSLKLFKPHQI